MTYSNLADRRAHDKATGYAVIRRYQKTPKGKAAAKRFLASPKGRRYQRNNNLVMHYGITADAWDAMFERQGKCCAVASCRAAHPGTNQGWHTHHTGSKKTGDLVVRGILCYHCNHVLTKHMTPNKLRGLASFMETYDAD